MKRHRILGIDFDSRVYSLDPIQEHWEESVKVLHRQNQASAIAELKAEFGDWRFDEKLENFKAIGAKQFSVVAFHNKFFGQARSAFVHGQYFPALTAVCALGERILNHLIIRLREEYRSHPLYKKVYRKDSFDYWPLAIDVLAAWGVLLPDAEERFRKLAEKRNAALHFNPATDSNDRELALDAIRNFGEIIDAQFCAFGQLPWLLCVPGERYIRKSWESHPFIRLVYLPNCLYVGHKHRVVSIFPWKIQDIADYASEDVEDDEFVRLRVEASNAS